MFRDITLGQFYPVDSVLHRMDPRMKIILTMLYITIVFVVKTVWGYAMALLLLCLGVLLANVPYKLVLRGLRPVLFITVFTFVLNLLFTQTGDEIWSLWIIRITTGGVISACRLAARIILLVAGTSLLTLTTSPILLTDGLERLLSPLKRIKFPVHELAMMMTIALRFIPLLAQEADRIMKAQSARGADYETGGLVKRALAYVPLIVPLFIGAFRRADDLATAMEARCYHGGEGRTRMRVLKMQVRDIIAFLLLVALVVLAIWGRL